MNSLKKSLAFVRKPKPNSASRSLQDIDEGVYHDDMSLPSSLGKESHDNNEEAKKEKKGGVFNKIRNSMAVGKLLSKGKNDHDHHSSDDDHSIPSASGNEKRKPRRKKKSRANADDRDSVDSNDEVEEFLTDLDHQYKATRGLIVEADDGKRKTKKKNRKSSLEALMDEDPNGGVKKKKKKKARPSTFGDSENQMNDSAHSPIVGPDGKKRKKKKKPIQPNVFDDEYGDEQAPAASGPDGQKRKKKKKPRQPEIFDDEYGGPEQAQGERIKKKKKKKVAEASALGDSEQVGEGVVLKKKKKKKRASEMPTASSAAITDENPDGTVKPKQKKKKPKQNTPTLVDEMDFDFGGSGEGEDYGDSAQALDEGALNSNPRSLMDDIDFDLGGGGEDGDYGESAQALEAIAVDQIDSILEENQIETADGVALPRQDSYVSDAYETDTEEEDDAIPEGVPNYQQQDDMMFQKAPNDDDSFEEEDDAIPEDVPNDQQQDEIEIVFEKAPNDDDSFEEEDDAIPEDVPNDQQQDDMVFEKAPNDDDSFESWESDTSEKKGAEGDTPAPTTDDANQDQSVPAKAPASIDQSSVESPLWESDTSEKGDDKASEQITQESPVVSQPEVPNPVHENDQSSSESEWEKDESKTGESPLEMPEENDEMANGIEQREAYFDDDDDQFSVASDGLKDDAPTTTQNSSEMIDEEPSPELENAHSSADPDSSGVEEKPKETIDEVAAEAKGGEAQELDRGENQETQDIYGGAEMEPVKTESEPPLEAQDQTEAAAIGGEALDSDNSSTDPDSSGVADKLEDKIDDVAAEAKGEEAKEQVHGEHQATQDTPGCSEIEPVKTEVEQPVEAQDQTEAEAISGDDLKEHFEISKLSAYATDSSDSDSASSEDEKHAQTEGHTGFATEAMGGETKDQVEAALGKDDSSYDSGSSGNDSSAIEIATVSIAFDLETAESEPGIDDSLDDSDSPGKGTPVQMLEMTEVAAEATAKELIETELGKDESSGEPVMSEGGVGEPNEPSEVSQEVEAPEKAEEKAEIASEVTVGEPKDPVETKKDEPSDVSQELEAPEKAEENTEIASEVTVGEPKDPVEAKKDEPSEVSQEGEKTKEDEEAKASSTTKEKTQVTEMKEAVEVVPGIDESSDDSDSSDSSESDSSTTTEENAELGTQKEGEDTKKLSKETHADKVDDELAASTEDKKVDPKNAQSSTKPNLLDESFPEAEDSNSGVEATGEGFEAKEDEDEGQSESTSAEKDHSTLAAEAHVTISEPVSNDGNEVGIDDVAAVKEDTATAEVHEETKARDAKTGRSSVANLRNLFEPKKLEVQGKGWSHKEAENSTEETDLVDDTTEKSTSNENPAESATQSEIVVAKSGVPSTETDTIDNIQRGVLEGDVTEPVRGNRGSGLFSNLKKLFNGEENKPTEESESKSQSATQDDPISPVPQLRGAVSAVMVSNNLGGGKPANLDDEPDLVTQDVTHQSNLSKETEQSSSVASSNEDGGEDQLQGGASKNQTNADDTSETKATDRPASRLLSSFKSLSERLLSPESFKSPSERKREIEIEKKEKMLLMVNQLNIDEDDFVGAAEMQEKLIRKHQEEISIANVGDPVMEEPPSNPEAGGEAEEPRPAGVVAQPSISNAYGTPTALPDDFLVLSQPKEDTVTIEGFGTATSLPDDFLDLSTTRESATVRDQQKQAQEHQLDTSANDLQNEVEELRNQLHKEQAELATFEREAAAFDAKLLEKDNQIATYKGMYDDLHKNYDQLLGEQKEQLEQNTLLLGLIEEMKKASISQESALADKDNRIEMLEKEVTALQESKDSEVLESLKNENQKLREMVKIQRQSIQDALRGMTML